MYSDVSECIQGLLCRRKIKDHVERMWEMRGEERTSWQGNGKIWLMVHTLEPRENTIYVRDGDMEVLKETWRVAVFTHFCINANRHTHTYLRHSLFIVCPDEGRWREWWGAKGEVMWESWSQARWPTRATRADRVKRQSTKCVCGRIENESKRSLNECTAGWSSLCKKKTASHKHKLLSKCH